MSVLMKDSDIKWIGKIPKDWKVKVLKRVLAEPLKYGANEAAEFENIEHPRYIRITDFGNDGLLKNNTFKSLEPQVAEPYLLNEGDVLFARSGATVGKTFQFKKYKGKACFAGYLIKANPQSYLMSSDFLYYFTKSPAYDTWKESIFTQATIQNIGADKYAYLPVVVPPLKTQKQIVDFLDKATLQIDDAIKTKEKQLKTLEALKKSIIHKAVTKGLDDSAEMIDSKIEWIGDIPKHWTTQMVKRTTIIKGRIGWQGLTSEEYRTEGNHLLVTGTDFKGRYINWNTCHYVEKERYDEDIKIQLKEKDILVTKDGTIGKIAMVKDMILPTTLNSGVFVTRPIKDEYIQEYMYWVLVSDMLMEYINYSKVGTTIAHLYQKTFEKFVYPLPPKNEQEKIVEFLDIEVEKINTLKDNVKKQIDKLTEYKKSLIYEYVTGKKQIKG